MNKIELNDDYINKIITGKSDILKLVWQEDLGNSLWKIVIKDQADEYFQGTVFQKSEHEYIIEGDTEFERIYPSRDVKTGKIVKIKESESHPPQEEKR